MTASETKYALCAEGLHKDYTYGYPPVSSDKTLSFRLKEGEFAVLFGPSACGKTTAARMIAGLLSSDSGTVTLFGETFDARQAVSTGFRPGIAIAHEDPERKLDRKKRVGTIIGEPLRAGRSRLAHHRARRDVHLPPTAGDGNHARHGPRERLHPEPASHGAQGQRQLRR